MQEGITYNLRTVRRGGNKFYAWIKFGEKIFGRRLYLKAASTSVIPCHMNARPSKCCKPSISSPVHSQFHEKELSQLTIQIDTKKVVDNLTCNYTIITLRKTYFYGNLFLSAISDIEDQSISTRHYYQQVTPPTHLS